MIVCGDALAKCSACGKRTTLTTFDAYRVGCQSCQQIVLRLAPQVADKGWMGWRYGIKVSSWRGISLGAEHWYGKAWAVNDDIADRVVRSRFNGSGPRRGETQYWDRDDNELPEHQWEWDIQRKLSTEDAKILTKKDQYQWRPGTLSNRFDSEGQVMEAGISLLTKKFGPDITIIDGDEYEACGDDLNVIYPKA